jgi:hypothetical protein
VNDALSRKFHDDEIGSEVLMEQLTQKFAIVQIVEVLKRVSPLAYKIELPPSLAGVHGVVHISKLC